jgi:hypothetical protein
MRVKIDDADLALREVRAQALIAAPGRFMPTAENDQAFEPGPLPEPERRRR